MWKSYSLSAAKLGHGSALLLHYLNLVDICFDDCC